MTKKDKQALEKAMAILNLEGFSGDYCDEEAHVFWRAGTAIGEAIKLATKDEKKN